MDPTKAQKLLARLRIPAPCLTSAETMDSHIIVRPISPSLFSWPSVNQVEDIPVATDKQTFEENLSSQQECNNSRESIIVAAEKDLQHRALSVDKDGSEDDSDVDGCCAENSLMTSAGETEPECHAVAVANGIEQQPCGDHKHQTLKSKPSQTTFCDSLISMYSPTKNHVPSSKSVKKVLKTDYNSFSNSNSFELEDADKLKVLCTNEIWRQHEDLKLNDRNSHTFLHQIKKLTGRNGQSQLKKGKQPSAKQPLQELSTVDGMEVTDQGIQVDMAEMEDTDSINITFSLANRAKETKKLCKKVCDVCGIYLSCSSALSRHRRLMHRKSQSHVCPVVGCKKQFARGELLESHMNCVHSETKPFQCFRCGKQFGAKKYLSDHLVRCGQTPYKCYQCQESFKNRGARRDHMAKRHEGQFFVCHCGKLYQWTSSLSKHQKMCPLSLS